MWRALLWLLAALAALAAGLALTGWGFDSVRSFRQLERVPRVEVAAILPGEVNLGGRAQVLDRVLTTQDSGSRTLYYRYLVEREERDSDGDTRWVTVSDETRYVNFLLDDGTGQALIQPAGVRANARNAYQRQQGRYRYTEYRIDPDDQVFVFGLARATAQGFAVGFTGQGSYTPILSSEDEAAERRGMAMGGLMATLGGVGLLALAVMFFCFALKVHQTFLLLGGTAAVVFAALTTLGVSTARQDVADSLGREQAATSAAEVMIRATLADGGLDWNGDWAALAREDGPQSLLPAAEQQRLRRVRLFLHQGALRAQRLRDSWPERWFAPTAAQAPVPLAVHEQAELGRLEGRFEPTRLAAWQAWLLGGIGGGLALLLGWLGFRRIRLKRLIENLPTTSPGGVVYGVNEVAGEARLPAGIQVLTGPLSARDCLQFSYHVEEERGSGKNTSWVTIERRSEGVAFHVSDERHALTVRPEGAEIITRHRDRRHEGSRRYTETRLEPGDRIYALGGVAVTEDGEGLEMRQGEGGVPFLLSNFSEQEVMLKKARAGFVLLVLGMVGGVAAGLGLAGRLGSFGALPWLLCAAVPLAYLALVLASLMYNDLVFLRQRIRATWANIEVSLRKRADLLPSLERVVKDAMGYEQELQRAVAELRSRLDTGRLGVEEGEAVLATGRVLRDRLVLLAERYPELKSAELVQRLLASLTRLEDEIAFMREGHNNAVERYNTRRGQFPEIMLAGLFRFRPLETFDRA